MKQLHLISIILLTTLLIACNKEDVDFTYSPAAPKAGDTISFTPYGTSAEEWEWDFGDGTSANIANYKKIYKKAGTYTVTLTADNKKSRSVAKQITVLDTIPSFTLLSDSVLHYMQSATFKALIYNPYNTPISYQWQIPDKAIATTNLDQNTISIYPTAHDTTFTISLTFTLGSQTNTIQKTFTVNDTPAPALLAINNNGQLLRQRLYNIPQLSNGNYIQETPQDITPLNTLFTQTSAMLTQDDICYIATLNNAIYAYNIQNNTLETIIKKSPSLNNTLPLFTDITIQNQFLYFTGPKGIHRIDKTLRSQTLDSEDQLIFADNKSLPSLDISQGLLGIDFCNNIFFAACQNKIIRFTPSDINSGSTPNTTPLFQDLNQPLITNIQIDKIQGLIYFFEKTASQIYICQLNGSNLQKITNTSHPAFTINNQLNLLFFSSENGILQTTLPHLLTNDLQLYTQPVNSLNNIVAIAIDQIKR